MNSLIRILLVEDDPADAKLALLTLAELGLDQQTLTLSNGMQALDWLHGHGPKPSRPPGRPVAILLDVKMPGLSGLEVLEQIRGAPALRLIPIVMLSASGQERDLRRAYELGANGYLIKSIDYRTSAANLRAFAQFFAVANEPPPGSLTSHRFPTTNISP